MIDVGIAIDAEATGVTFYPKQPDSYDARGNRVTAASTGVAGRAVIQPVSGRILRDLPEGVRDEASHSGWSRRSVVLGDEIGYRGERFRVVHVWSRPMDGFNKYALKRIK